MRANPTIDPVTEPVTEPVVSEGEDEQVAMVAVAAESDGHTYVLVVSRENCYRLPSALGNWADDERLNFTWDDAVNIQEIVHEQFG